MSDTVKLTIDGRSIEAPAGATILEAATAANIFIPNLCNNPELKPYGACRLCMVEVEQKKRTKMVASCLFEVAEGLSVTTENEKVNRIRAMVMELMLVRNSKHPVILDLARRLKVEKSRFDKDIKGCIMCGMCVRVCKEVVGVNAIGYKSRGALREVATPFDSAPPDCIACGSCAYICPVDFIQFTEKDGVRTIWNTDFELQKCKSCGRDIAPVKQLEHFKKTLNLPDDHFDICLHCRKN